MRRNAINVRYNPGHVTLWCIEVVPVVYAKVALSCSSIASWAWMLNILTNMCILGYVVIFVRYDIKFLTHFQPCENQILSYTVSHAGDHLYKFLDYHLYKMT